MFRSLSHACACLLSIAALTASLTLGIFPIAQAQTVQPAAGTDALPSGKVLIPEGTLIHITLLKDLKSGADKSGEEVPFEVSKDVFGPGHVLLIAEQTQTFGKIIESSRRGIFGKSGKLKFTIDYVLSADKTHIPLRADAQLIRGRDNRTTAIASAILFAPIAMFINGKDVSVKKGQEFTMYVDANTISQSPLVAPPPAPVSSSNGSSKSLFLLTNGNQVVGTLTSFDGTLYSVATESGTQNIKASEVKSVYSLAR